MLYAGVAWECLIPRNAYIWIIPEALNRADLRPLRELVDNLPIDNASAVIDTKQPHLVKWINFMRFSPDRKDAKGNMIYRRSYGR